MTPITAKDFDQSRLLYDVNTHSNNINGAALDQLDRYTVAGMTAVTPQGMPSADGAKHDMTTLA